MKIAIITDLHFGVKKANVRVHEYFYKFYEQVLFPFLTENGITTLFILGDVVEHRKFMNYACLQQMHDRFFTPLRDMGISVYSLVGNHDLYYRTNDSVNALSEMFSFYENLVIVDKPKSFNFDGVDIACLPWIHKGNAKDVSKFLKEDKSDILMAHLELNGFKMHGASLCEGGMDKKFFRKYDMVMTGHFHHRSDDGQVFYLGTPYQITWSDYGEVKGFHVFDTDDRSLTFHENPHKLFKKVEYDPEEEYDFNDFTDKYVKVTYGQDTNQKEFDLFVDGIHNHNPIDLETKREFELEVDDDDVEVEELEEMLMNYVDISNVNQTLKGKVKNKLNELHQGASE